MIDHINSQTNPALKTILPPYISARRPKGRRKAPVTRLKTLAGHVSAFDGMSRETDTGGRRILNPDVKYSAKKMDPNREKQKLNSIHIELNVAGRSLPSLSSSSAVYIPVCPSSISESTPIR
jgi:hypothetical protein